MKHDIGGKTNSCISSIISIGDTEYIATGIMGGNNGRRLVKMMEDRGVTCVFVFQEGRWKE